MLWMEADRMGFFLNAVPQEKFEIQRAQLKLKKVKITITNRWIAV